MLVLRVVHEEPMHGYQLIDELEGRGFVKSGRFETGSIYTILNRMEKRGLLSSTKTEAESGRVRRVYSVTEAGESVLKEALRALMARKKVTDSLAEYYNRVFASEV
jgi:PadR family transcriptional regulator PadR